MTTETDTNVDTAPITFTAPAQERIKGFISAQGDEHSALRIEIQGRSGAGFRYAMGIVDGRDREATDVEFDGGGFPVLVAADSLDDLRGTSVDFVDGPDGSGLKVENPNPVWRDDLSRRIQEIVDTRINPAVASHGGTVELLAVADDIAYVRLGGGCVGCGMADVTLKQGIEAMIMDAEPSIIKVVDQTDHASGTNPYFQPAKG